MLDWAAVQPFAGPEGLVRLRESGAGCSVFVPTSWRTCSMTWGGPSAASLLDQLDAEVAADVLEEAPPSRAAELLREATPERAAAVLRRWSPTRSRRPARIDDDTRRRLLSRLASEEAEHLDTLVHFSARTAGGHMTSRVVIARLPDTVADVRERLRLDSGASGGLDAIVVVDEEGRVFDDISMLDCCSQTRPRCCRL